MKKILITDDEPRIVRLIKGMIDWDSLPLELVGEANDGVEALRIMERVQPDILIADIQMPGLDGLQLISKAMILNPNLAVIIISGYKEFDYAYAALKSGVYDYLIKPINQVELNNSLRRILNLQQADRNTLLAELQQNRRQQMMGNCIHGIAEFPDSLDRFNTENSFHFQEGIFAALTVSLCPCDKSLPLDAANQKVQDSIISTLNGQCSDLECYVVQSDCWCIFNFLPERSHTIYGVLKELGNILHSKITEEFALPLVVGVSKFHTQLAMLSACCAESLLCCKTSCIVGRNQVIFADEIGLDTPYSILTNQHVNAFRSAIVHFDSAVLSQTIAELFATLQPVLTRQPWQIEHFLKELVDIFQQEILKGNIKISPDEEASIVEQLYWAKDLQEVFILLTDWFAQKIQSYHDTITDHYREPIRIARKYIEAHFAEQISLEDICTKVGFSYHYFSALYKQETGENISDYITKVRIQHAKMLLTTTKDSIQKISNQSGYVDMKHFNKSFRKQVGIRPTEYRMLHT